MDVIPLTFSLTPLWKKLFDMAYIISLDISSERRDKITKELERVGLENYEFRICEKDTESTKRGCFNSHQKIINQCYYTDINRILILEDDAYFIESITKIKESLENILAWMENKFNSNESFDIFFLGHLPLIPFNLVDSNKQIIKTPCSRYTHAYIVTRQGMENISKIEYDGRHYDLYIGNLEENFSLYPMISYQDDVVSVNDFNKIYKFFSGIRNTISCRRLCRTAEILCFFKGMRILGKITEKSIEFTKKNFLNKFKICKNKQNTEYNDIL